MTRVILVRHGHPWPDVSEENPDPPLSETGAGQAAALARELARRLAGPLLASSPLRRSRQTAQIVGSFLGTDVLIDPDLAEIRGVGAGDGAARDGLSRRWLAGDLDAAYPGGETLGDALVRFESVLSRLVREAGERDLVLVSHGAFIAMGLIHLRGDGELTRLTHCSAAELDTVAAPGSQYGRARVWNAPEVAAQPGRWPGR